MLGNAGFQFAVSGHLPNNLGALLLGLGGLTPGVPVPGAPVTVNIYVNPVSTVLLFTDALGTTSYGLPLPPSNALVGLPITAQSIDFDVALAAAVPIGSSQGVQVTVGN